MESSPYGFRDPTDVRQRIRKCCLFCKALLDSTNRSREHVIPAWLVEHLNVTNESITPNYRSSETGEILSIRRQTIDELLEGRVCATCNNGWMSSLEQTIQPLLIQLMATHRHVRDLDPEQHIQLARWACKTAWVLNSSSNFHQNVPQEHFRHVYCHEHELPPRVVVVAQHHSSTRQFSWLQCAAWPAEISEDITKTGVEKLARGSYKIGLQFGDLMLLVAYWPYDGWYYSLQMNLHIPLWPARGMCGWHSGEDWHLRESEQAFYGFHSALMIVNETRLKQCAHYDIR
jgi:hypothetical protein